MIIMQCWDSMETLGDFLGFKSCGAALGCSAVTVSGHKGVGRRVYRVQGFGPM